MLKIMQGMAFLCVMGVLLVCGGCAAPKMWYKQGHNQADFDLDHRECQIIAEEIGRQATITGKKADLDVFAATYTNCIFSRGWTRTPPGEEKKNVQAAPLAKIDKTRIHVFGEKLMLPDDFTLKSNRAGGFEDVKIQNMVFEGDGPVFANIIIQEVLSRQFDAIDYPINEPFFVYDRGRDDLNGNKKVHWAVFSGEFEGNWMAGIGAYYLMGKYRRINLVLTIDIPAQHQAPPDGLLLTERQKKAVTSFSNQWLGYIKSGMKIEAR